MITPRLHMLLYAVALAPKIFERSTYEKRTKFELLL